MTLWRRVPTWVKALAGLAVFAAVAWTAFAFWAIGSIFQDCELDGIPQAQLETWIGLDLPDTLTGLHSHAAGWQDYQVFVRFDLPARELEGFLKRNRLEPATDPDPTFEGASLERDWWTPGALKGATTYRLKSGSDTAQATTKTFFYPTVVIGPSAGSLVTVYVYAFNT